MISDYFSPKVRATVLAIYSSGIYLGSGIGLFLGGAIVQSWHAWSRSTLAPLGIKAWQAAFHSGYHSRHSMAIWVWTLKEPMRVARQKVWLRPSTHPFKAASGSFMSVLPGFSFLPCIRRAAFGR